MLSSILLEIKAPLTRLKTIDILSTGKWNALVIMIACISDAAELYSSVCSTYIKKRDCFCDHIGIQAISSGT